MSSKRYIYANEFHDIFGVFLKSFWDKWTGFDAPKFDKEVVKSTDKESISESIKRQWGERAQQIIHDLISEMPILDRMEPSQF